MNDAVERGSPDTQIVLCVLPKWEQQSVVLQATRAKVIAGLLHQHKPGLHSLHGVSRSG